MTPSAEELAFNQAYFLSRSPNVQRLMEIGTQDPYRVEAAKVLAHTEIVDDDIDVLHKSAYLVMQNRVANGVEHFPPYGQKLKPPVGPEGPIWTSVNIEDYPPIYPPRLVNITLFHQTVSWLNQNGIYTANEDGVMMIPAGRVPQELSPSDLKQYNNPAVDPSYNGSILFQFYSQPHFGIVIAGVPGGLVSDAEMVALSIPEGITAVKAYLESIKH